MSSSTSSSSPPQKGRASAPFAVSLVASAAAGGLEPLLSYPLEYVKTSQQLHNSIRPSHLHRLAAVDGVTSNTATTQSVLESIKLRDGRTKPMIGVRGVVQDVWRRNGWQGFYRGVGVVAVAGVAKAFVRIGTYDGLKRSLQTSDGRLSGSRSLMAGMGAGVTETLLVVVPSETVKTKLIHATTLPRDHTLYSAASHSSLNAVRTLHAIGGTRAMFGGVTATLARQTIAGMTRFGSYQSLKNIVGGSMRPGQKLPSGITFALGAASGLATVVVTMPLDVAKTRMQSIGARQRYGSTWWCLVQTVQEEGLRTLWRGSTMRLCRLTLSGAVTFVVYEDITSLLGYA